MKQFEEVTDGSPCRAHVASGAKPRMAARSKAILKLSKIGREPAYPVQIDDCAAPGARFACYPRPEGDLPQYLCAAQLDSVGGAVSHTGDVSFLTLAWLSSSLDVGVTRLVASVLASINWELTAQSASWEQYL
jgi:hypothetical protein